MTENFTKEEKEYITNTLRILIFNLADCAQLLNYYDYPDSKRDIVKDTIQRDLNYLTKLDGLVKEKFNKGA